jgi:hypothetical protein
LPIQPATPLVLRNLSTGGTKRALAAGLAAAALCMVALISMPGTPWLQPTLADTTGQYSLSEELAANFTPWAPLDSLPDDERRRVVESSHYGSLQAAADDLEDGDLLKVNEGIYREAIVVRASNIVVEGAGHVVLDGVAAERKAAIVNKGDSNVIRNLECRGISVRDRNGACVRHEGVNVRLEHVYFHDSEQGLLAGGQNGRIELIDSRFERLGRDGMAHGIYVGGDELVIRDSLILASKSEGHEVKSRAARTLIERSVIASFSSEDSRIVDVPNGGVLIIRNSVLQQGSGSSNRDAIGYGLEGIEHDDNRIVLTGNLFLLERAGRNVLLNLRNASRVMLDSSNNVVVSPQDPALPGSNLHFESRSDAGLAAYPSLPPVGSF